MYSESQFLITKSTQYLVKSIAVTKVATRDEFFARLEKAAAKWITVF